MERIQSIVRSCNLSFSEIKNKYADDFEKIYQREKEWLGDIDHKINKLSNQEDKVSLENVVRKIKMPEYIFVQDDSDILSKFIVKINELYHVTDWINNFKENKNLGNDARLSLFLLFNEIKKANSLSSLNLSLNKNLKTFLPHLFSIIKHIQNPSEYLIYYKYWKNIAREVFLKKDDYDSLCNFYREISVSESRHLNFGCYFGVIGVLIAKNINNEKIINSVNDKNYRYLKDKVLNIPEYLNLIQTGSEDRKSKTKYWLYSPGEGAAFWDEFFEKGIMAIGNDELGDLANYSSKEELVSKLQQIEETESSKKNDATANFEFKEVMSIGDIIIVKKGRRELLGYGVVTSDYYYDETRSTYQKCRNVDWKKKGVWEAGHDLVIKALTDITDYGTELSGYEKYYQRLLATINEAEKNKISGDDEMINTPLNLILYGPPGTGKTYNTINKALEIIYGIDSEKKSKTEIESEIFKEINSGKDMVFSVDEPKKEFIKIQKMPDSREKLVKTFEFFKAHQIKTITFHQSYSYEDFVEGVKPIPPKTDGNNSEQMIFKVQPGIFRKICEEAESDLSNDYEYVLIIDEINRGNVASIFGELITLIEPDKRIGTKYGMKVRLPYSGQEFGVPSNLHIIGTMNTADRSVEALDAALRRRFQFEEMMPEPELFEKDEWKWKKFDIKKLLETMNKRLEVLLDRDHQIGHSYFMVPENERNIEKLQEIFKYNIIPQLREYFFGDPEKIRLVLGNDFFAEEKMEQKNIFDEGIDTSEYIEESEKRWILKKSDAWKFDKYLRNNRNVV